MEQSAVPVDGLHEVENELGPQTYEFVAGPAQVRGEVEFADVVAERSQCVVYRFYLYQRVELILARGGRLVTCGATTGGNVQVSLHALFFKSLSLLGSTMGSKGDLHRIVDLVAAGRLRPVLAHTLPFDQVAGAHRMLEERTAMGKIALVV